MDDDDLNGFKGLMNGLAIGLVMWLAIIGLIWRAGAWD